MVATPLLNHNVSQVIQFAQTILMRTQYVSHDKETLRYGARII